MLRPEIIDAIPAPVWCARPDGSVEFFNRHWLDYSGLTAEQATGWGWVAVLHPDERGQLVDNWKSMANSGGPMELEARFRRFDGEFRCFLCRGNPLRDERGNVVKWYGTNTDIEDRKCAEEAMRASEWNFHLIVDNIPGMVCTMNPAGGLEFANRRIMDYFGRPFEELRNWANGDIVHPADLPRTVAAWMHSVQTGHPYFMEHRLLRADGACRWFQAHGLPFRNPEGRIIRWYMLLIDIDDRKNAKDALNKARADLARATRITAMGELAAALAHEVNQPLAAIVTNADACLRWLNRATPDLDEARVIVQRIARDGKRGCGVVTRVRSLLRNETSERIRVAVNEVVEESVQLLQAELHGATLRLELARRLPPVAADRVQLQQVLLNLMMNALEAMKPVTDRPRVLTIETRSDGNEAVLVAVQDSGVGLQPERIDQLFETFYTTKPNGLGMGLSVCRSIIESHGGRLWAERIASPGARFLFILPTDNGGVA